MLNFWIEIKFNFTYCQPLKVRLSLQQERNIKYLMFHRMFITIFIDRKCKHLESNFEVIWVPFQIFSMIAPQKEINIFHALALKWNVKAVLHSKCEHAFWEIYDTCWRLSCKFTPWYLSQLEYKSSIFIFHILVLMYSILFLVWRYSLELHLFLCSRNNQLQNCLRYKFTIYNL